MPTLGGWGGMPFRMGGGKCLAQGVYEQLRDGAGTAFSRDDSTRANREKRCMALAIARAAAAQERGGMQSLPDLATDRLPDWERALQAPVDPSEPRHVRAATCMGMLQGNGVAERDAIAQAVSTALGGESVTVLVTKAKPVPMQDSESDALSLSEVAAGGSLSAGSHTIAFAYDVPSAGSIVLSTAPATITISNGSAILVGPTGISATRLHYYMSKVAGSTELAWVADQYGDGPIVLAHYPTDPPIAALHHMAVLVSAATAASTIKRAKIHAVLGPMLPAWTTYDILASSPFVLGANGSLLGTGGL